MHVGPPVAKDSSVDRTILETPVRVFRQAGLGGGPSAPHPATPAAGDSVSGLLQQLAAPQIANLISGIAKEHLTPGGPPMLELMQSSVDAVAAHDGPRALGTIMELVARYPEKLDVVRTEPAFAPIRTSVENVLQQHMLTTRTDAELKVSLAAHAFETSGPATGRDVERDVPQILSVAHQLLETDRHANVLLAGDLAQNVINYYIPVAVAILDMDALGRKRTPGEQAPPSGEAATFGMLYSQVVRSLTTIGERVPLKFLVWAWFLIGLISGLLSVILRILEIEIFSAALPLEIWGAGTVGFLGFGTYRVCKKAPHPKL
jgi:hypothetical protein